MTTIKHIAHINNSESSKKAPSRLVIYPKDVQNITGKNIRTARNFLATLKKSLGKARHQYITIPEFCEFTGMPENTVRELMID